MSKEIPEYQVKQNLLSSFRNPKECAEKINDLKNSTDYSLVNSLVQYLKKNIPPFEKCLFGNSLPEKITELGTHKTYFYKPESLKNEINWIILSIKNSKEIIKKFIVLRKSFEHEILLGENDKALQILSVVEKEIGVSIWLYESKLLVFELMKKPEEAITLLSKINEARLEDESNNKKNKQKINNKKNENGFVSLLLHYLSYRAQRDISALRYDQDLFNNFKRNRTEFQNDYYNYYLFRLNFYVNYNIDDPSIPLIMESTNSIVDRYVVLIQVLQAAFLKEESKDTIISRSKALYKLTEDSILLPYMFLSNPEYDCDDYFDKEYLDIIDLYYRGKYSEVIIKCKNYIKLKTDNFEVLRFYCFSLLFANNGYSPIHLDQSPINQISRKIFNSISEKDNSSSLYNLYQLNKNLYGFTIANGLDYFIKEENNSEKSDELRFLSLKYFDPIYSKIFKSDSIAIKYLENGCKKIGQSTSTNHQINRIKKSLINNTNIVEHILEKDNAKILYEKQDYQGSYDAWITILEKNRQRNPIIQIAINSAFDCLLKLEKYQEAIKLFVTEYIQSPIGVKKTNVDSFIGFLKKQKYKNIKRSIELPIFVGLNSSKDTDKSFILKSFCDYYDVKKPSELFDEIDDIDIHKKESFFYVIVSEDILRHYYHINSTPEELEEKRKLLMYLINLDTPKIELYKKMLDEVFDELIIYKGNRKIDESKIYANDQAIIKYELKDIDGLYDRFMTQYKILESEKPILVLKKVFHPVMNSKIADATILSADFMYTDNAIYQVAYDLYDGVRDKFLFSKFGLGTYLSTRIRHGVLEGELRSDFVACNLMLNKTNEKYVNNEYWARTYGLDKRSNDELYKILSEFSEKVDDFISYFKFDVLQIKIIEKERGYFNYDVNAETLSLQALEIAINAKDSDEFSQLVIKNLWQITERNLQTIRSYIKNNLSEEFHKLLNELDLKVNIPALTHIRDDFNKTISDIRTNTNQKLTRIEGWFHIQESKFDNFKLDELLSIVWDSTEKFYPKNSHPLESKLQGAKITIKAAYGIHFSDIMRIFLTNMFKNSIPRSTFKIDTKIENQILTLTFENQINVDTETLNKEFDLIMESTARLSLEGKSGLIKAKKILKYDLGDLSNYVCIKAVEGKCIATIRINLENLTV
ncbi:hypothetical protein [Labilibaculum antarcticum]|uniref:Uncharacterized protein n=1 Tax=Labilibaculum antarcticum TaxID=1717717 RepID=A0A1Y1CPL7_9BACT|nr:hypothetical protein [Labilibaculum antarcticum]BAX81943.1 hypothetical protein ALGA_3651 [Labilibaculum antarcticum]